jgi:glucokinase
MRRPPSPLTPKALADAAAANVPGAREIWNEVGTWLGLGLANAVLIFNPEAVLLLGGVARAGRLILDPIRRVFDAQPFRGPFDALTLAAPAERDWGCVGAALLSREAR